jgi:hypothetical protein
MAPRTATGEGFTLTVSSPPEDWYAAASVVPALRSPHELFAFSNRPLQQVPPATEENHPAIGELDSAAMFIWGYYEVLGDPEIGDPSRPPIPDYSRYSLPFAYNDSEAFPSQSAYDWSPTNFIWRRIGLDLPPNAQRAQRAALTVMVWEGTTSSVDDVSVAASILSSVAVA